MNDLLLWCEGRMLLLVFGRIPAMDVPRLRDLALRLPVRVVQVVETKVTQRKAHDAEHPVAVEHVFDLQGHLRRATLKPSERWTLVRPDAYVVGSGESGPAWRSQVIAMLSKAIGAAP